MIIETDELKEILSHCESADDRYGNFASTHEAMGVAAEEWDELRAAVHSNDIEAIRNEAIDLAAVMLRLAAQCRHSPSMVARSVK